MRILVGMSGGLDSTYAALKLINEGHEVEGAVVVIPEQTETTAAKEAAAALGIPILMFTLGLVKKDVRCIGSTMLITVLSYTVIHFINVFINSYTEKHQILDWASNVIKVNYMYSITPENPLLDLFYSIIPYEYWYMYLCFLIAAVYLGIVYAPEWIALIKEKRREKN